MFKFKKIEESNLLKEKDIIKILNKPSHWNSILNKNNPIDESIKLKFPYILKIKKMSPIFNPSYLAMTCGEYGWDLESIIKAGCEKLETPEKWYWYIDDIELYNELIGKIYNNKLFKNQEINKNFVYPEGLLVSNINHIHHSKDYKKISTKDIKILLNKELSNSIIKEELNYFYNKFKQNEKSIYK